MFFHCAVLGTGRNNMTGFISPPFTTSSLTPSRIPKARQQRIASTNFYNGGIGMFKSNIQSQSHHIFTTVQQYLPQRPLLEGAAPYIHERRCMNFGSDMGPGSARTPFGIRLSTRMLHPLKPRCLIYGVPYGIRSAQLASGS